MRGWRLGGWRRLCLGCWCSRSCSCRGIAASRISSRVGRYGKVQSVSVSAWPAVELLWGHADSVHGAGREPRAEPGAGGEAAVGSTGRQRAWT